MSLLSATAAANAQSGSIRGLVRDADFDAPLPEARVTVVETGRTATTTDQGTFTIGEVAPGTYTVVFAKPGYVRAVEADVVVVAGRLTDLEVALSGEFTEMEEFVVQDLQVGTGTEAALLELRFESPSLLDSISADLMSRAGASDAASALTLVSGATVQDGKFAVIRGLPDRYVSSQLNGVRLPTADEDTRAVELDQFPSAVIESIQVSKTFTPDQQGDASGGAVDVRLKGIPSETILQFKSQVGFNDRVEGSEFLSYRGGGFDFWGGDDSGREVQTGNIGGNWEGAVGVATEDAPIDTKWSGSAGGRGELLDGLEVGGLVSFFYERDSSFYDDGIDDSYDVVTPGQPLTPKTSQGTPEDGTFKTALFDVTRGRRSVQWGGLASVGLETENHSLGVSYLYSKTTDDVAILAEDTRGKQFFFPGFDPDDPTTPGHDEPNGAPYLRTETLEFTERSTGSLQFAGDHHFEVADEDLDVDWVYAKSFADLDQPDKRQFGSFWLPASEPLPGFEIPAEHFPFKPSANFNLGNLQRIFKTIEEKSDTWGLNAKLSFDQWSRERGYVQAGLFSDRVEREFRQDTFSNFGDSGSSFVGGFEDFWSASFPFEDHPILASDFDIDYDGKLNIDAAYGMFDLPLSDKLKVIGGARFESTDIDVVVDPEPSATWFPPGAVTQVKLNPGDADVDFARDDVLPAVALVYEPVEEVTLRASYSETVARQTFKELTPVVQQEFLGGPIFVGNPELGMGSLRNYDLRADWRPYDGSLVSVSWFYKDLEDPIEFVQRIASNFTYTTAVNYPEGRLSGWELELRQTLERFWEPLEGFAVGANATFIDSDVTLPEDEAAGFSLPSIQAPMTHRDATNAPEYLYNLYLTWDHAPSTTQVALFYTVRGDTLVAGAASASGDFVPSVYEKAYGTLNLSVSKALGEHVSLKFQAKNLTDPDIEEVYRSDFTGPDVTKTSFNRGREFSLGLTISN